MMPSNPDHLPTQPRPLLFPPIPTSLDVFSPFALHLPIQNFCCVSLHGRTLASSQGFQGAPAPRQDGEPPSERCLGSQGGRKSEPCPALPGRLPQEGFPGSERTKVLRKELGIRISQSQTGTSLYHFKVLFRGGEGKSVSFPVAFIPEAEREGGKKKRRRFCDVFANRLKKRESHLSLKKKKKKWMQRAKAQISPNLPIPGKIKCHGKAEPFAEGGGGMERGARLCPAAVPARCRRSASPFPAVTGS